MHRWSAGNAEPKESEKPTACFFQILQDEVETRYHQQGDKGGKHHPKPDGNSHGFEKLGLKAFFKKDGHEPDEGGQRGQ